MSRNPKRRLSRLSRSLGTLDDVRLRRLDDARSRLLSGVVTAAAHLVVQRPQRPREPGVEHGVPELLGLRPRRLEGVAGVVVHLLDGVGRTWKGAGGLESR